MPHGCTRSRRSAVLLALGVLVAPALAVDDPATTGRLPVGITTVTLVDPSRGRTLETEVWYPARTAGRNAVVRHGRYPLVLVAHGLCGFRTNYEYLTIHLAGRGFLVAAPDFPGFTKATCDSGTLGDLAVEPPVDLSFLRRTFHDRRGPVAALARAVRGRPTGLVGHSLGGLAVVNAALKDAHFRAVVALAPFATTLQAKELGELRPRPALFVMGGTADTSLAAGTVRPFFDALVAPAFFVRITNGTHSGFTDMDRQLSTDRLAGQENIVKRYATAFLAHYLAHSRYQDYWLRAADSPEVAVIAHLRH